MKKLTLLLVLIVIVTVIGMYLPAKPLAMDNNKMEQLIPDAPTEEEIAGKRVAGDYVPSNEETADGWILSNPLSNGQQFSYPKTLKVPADQSYPYVTEYNWPPKVELIAGGVKCITSTKKNAQNQSVKTELKTIDSEQYCVQTFSQERFQSEGANKQIFVTYDYTINQDGDYYGHANFTIAYADCGQFGEDEEAVCKKAQEAVKVDTLAKRMIDSLRML